MDKKVSGITVTQSGFDIGATTTIECLIDFLSNITSYSTELIFKEELLGVLRSIRTPQYRAATALGDALVHCTELRLLLLATQARLTASTTPDCSTVKGQFINNDGYRITGLDFDLVF